MRAGPTRHCEVEEALEARRAGRGTHRNIDRLLRPGERLLSSFATAYRAGTGAQVDGG